MGLLGVALIFYNFLHKNKITTAAASYQKKGTAPKVVKIKDRKCSAHPLQIREKAFCYHQPSFIISQQQCRQTT